MIEVVWYPPRLIIPTIILGEKDPRHDVWNSSPVSSLRLTNTLF